MKSFLGLSSVAHTVSSPLQATGIAYVKLCEVIFLLGGLMKDAIYIISDKLV